MSTERSADQAALLRRHGLQVTAQRLAVLRAVSRRARTAPPTTSTPSCGPRSAPSRARRSTTPSGRPHREGPPPAHPARRVAGPLRGPRRRQPPPPHLPDLRPDGRRRLRGRRHPVPDGRRRLGLRDRRSRGHLLGPMPRVRRRRPSRRRPTALTQPNTTRRHEPASEWRSTDCLNRAARARTRSSPPPLPKPGRPHDEPGLVAEPARPVGPHQHSPLSNPMGEDFDYAEEFETLDLDALKRDLIERDDHVAGLVAGRLRPLRAALHPHGLARRRHLPHRRRPRRRRRAARSASPRSTAGPTTPASTRRAGCSGRSSRSTAARSPGPT